MKQVLSTTAESASRLKDKELTLIVDGHAYKMTSTDGISVNTTELDGLYSTQEETDTRVIVYCLHAKEEGYKHAIVRSPDSDILFILLHYAEQLKPLIVFFETGKGAQHRLINITTLADDLTPRYCEALLGRYCFTGEDSNCAVKSKGKVGPLKQMEKTQKFMDTFIRLGKEWQPDEEANTELEEFTCHMYGKPTCKSVNTARASMIRRVTGGSTSSLKDLKKVDLSRLPPCKRALVPHIKRVNYRLAQWKHAHLPTADIPLPTEDHGWTQREGRLEPMWNDGPVLPPSLNEIACSNEKEDSEDETMSLDGSYYSSSESDSD